MINYIDYSHGNGSLDCEINNYLYFLKFVCLDKKNVRRFVYRVINLYLKLDSLFVNYSDGSIEEKRTLRKASRYIKGIKKYVKDIKKIDSSIFSLAASRLEEKNTSLNNDNINYLNRYSKNKWDSDQISRTLIGDINGMIKRKRKNTLSSEKNNSSSIIFFDDLENNNKEFDNSNKEFDNSNKEFDNSNKEFDNSNKEFDISNKELDKIDLEKKINNNSLNDLFPNNENVKKDIEANLNEDNFFNFNNRLLTISELYELKKEIDLGDDIFIDLNNVSNSQSDFIKSYISVCDKYQKIEKSIHLIYDNSSIDFVIDLYKQIYDFVGFLISEMLEQIISLSKISCESTVNNLYNEKYLMDKNAFDVFVKFDVFIAKIQNYLKLLDDKKFKSLSDEDKKYLSKYLWDKYRLENINPFSIKEAVGLDLMSFINKNIFTLVQTVLDVKRNKENYKKYDLDIILENIDYNLEKYFPELAFSMQKKIDNDVILNNDEKLCIILNIKKSFAKKIGLIHGITELPSEAYDYCLSYILNKVFSCEFDDDLSFLYEECVNDIYHSKMEKYKTIDFFDKIIMILSGNNIKPNINKIKKELDNFCSKISNVNFDLS